MHLRTDGCRKKSYSGGIAVNGPMNLKVEGFHVLPRVHGHGEKMQKEKKRDAYRGVLDKRTTGFQLQAVL